MEEICTNEQLRVRSKAHTSLDMLLITVMAAAPFLPYVLSACVLIVVAISILAVKQTRCAMFKNKSMFFISVGISAVSLVSSLISGNIIGILISFGVFLILTFAAYARTVMNKELFERVIAVSCFGTFLQFTAVILETVLNLQAVKDGYRPVGFAFNANYLGSISVLAALIALAALFENKDLSALKENLAKNLIYLASVLANCVILLICESRSSLLGLMAGAFVMLLLKRRYVLCGIGIVGGAGIWLLGYFSPEMFGWTNSLTAVFTQRVGIWLCALDGFTINPVTVLIGMGPMSYLFAWSNGLIDPKWADPAWVATKKYLNITNGFSPAEMAEYIKTAHHVHNIYVDTLINVGIIGAVLYALLIGGFIRNAMRRLNGGDKSAFTMIIVAVIVILVQGIPDVTIMWHQTAILFVIMCAASFKEDNRLSQ